MNYSITRGLISAIIGAIIGTIVGEHILSPRFWWIGMFVGALIGALALNPKKFVTSVREAFIFSVKKWFRKETGLLLLNMLLLAPLKAIGFILYSLLIPSILSASFFLPIFILIDKGDLANWFVVVLIFSGVFAFFVGLEDVFHGKSGANFYVFSKKRTIFVLFATEK
jgi:MFS family permease